MTDNGACDLCGKWLRIETILGGMHADGRAWHLQFCGSCSAKLPPDVLPTAAEAAEINARAIKDVTPETLRRLTELLDLPDNDLHD